MCESGLFQKVLSHKLEQNANFENRGTNIQRGILQVLLNILSIYCHTSSFYREVVLKKINKMWVAG